MKRGTYRADGLDPFSTRSDCVECEVSNPAHAPCCWRCGGELRVDALAQDEDATGEEVR